MPAGSVTLRKFRGVNLDADPRDLEDDELAASYNMYEKDPGVIQSRPVTRRFYQATSWVAQDGPLQSDIVLYPFREASGLWHLLIWKPGTTVVGAAPTFAGMYEMYPAVGGLYGINWDIKTYADARVVEQEGRPQFVTWNNKVYVFTGRENPGFVFTPNGTQQMTVSQLGTAWPAGDRPRARVATVYQNSFMLAGFDAPEESTIRWLDINDPDTLVDVTKSMYIRRGDGDRIMGAFEVPVVGGANYVESYLMVWKRNSTWMLQGAPPTAATDGSLRLTPVNPKEGLIAKETIAATKDGVVWCSGKDVWLMPFGGTPVSIGKKISKMLKSRAQGAKDAWYAIYHEGFYKLVIPRVETYVDQKGIDFELTPTEQWWCDLSDFAEEGAESVRWWGPMTVPMTGIAVDNTQPGESTVYGMQAFRSRSNADDPPTQPLRSNVTLLTMINDPIDIPGVFATTEDYGRTDDHTMSGFENYDHEKQELRFKEFDFGDADKEKIFEKVWVNIWTDIAITFELQMIGDGGDTVRDVDPEFLETGEAGFVLGTDILDTGRLKETWETVTGYPPDGSRFLSKTWQPVLRYAPQNPVRDPTVKGAKIKFRSIGVKVRVIGREPS